MRFGVGPVELEMQAVVTKEANGKVGWKIVELGGSAGKESTQSVKLTLTPVWWDPTKREYRPDWLVSGMLPNTAARDADDTEAARNSVAAQRGSADNVGVP